MRRFFLIIVVGLLGLSISSCCKAIIQFNTLLKNTTDQEIEVKYFDNLGQVISHIIKSKSETIRSPLPKPIDSVLVFSNGTLQEIHYSLSIKKTVSNAKIIPYGNLENLLNENNYQKSRKEIPCNGSNATFMRMKDDYMKNGQLKPIYNA